MNKTRALLVGAALSATATGVIATAATEASASVRHTGTVRHSMMRNGATPRYADLTVRPMTPNECIRINGGDFNACNVGNSGRGDLPYQRAQ